MHRELATELENQRMSITVSHNKKGHVLWRKGILLVWGCLKIYDKRIKSGFLDRIKKSLKYLTISVDLLICHLFCLPTKPMSNILSSVLSFSINNNFHCGKGKYTGIEEGHYNRQLKSFYCVLSGFNKQSPPGDTPIDKRS